MLIKYVGPVEVTEDAAGLLWKPGDENEVTPEQGEMLLSNPNFEAANEPAPTPTEPESTLDEEEVEEEEPEEEPASWPFGSLEGSDE